MKNITSISTILFLAIASLFTLNANAQEPTFQAFIAQFPKAELPYTLSEETLQVQIEAGKTVKATRLAWDFYQFLPELERSAQYSSKVVHPEPVASFETEEYFAVLYNIARGISRNNKTYSISIFDKAGNYVGTHFVAGVNANTLTAASIDEQLNATVKAYKLNWATATEGKKVVGMTLTEGQTFGLINAGNPDEIVWSSQVEVETSDLVKMK